MAEFFLEFEKPVVELERKIDELRGLAAGSVKFDDEIKNLEKKAKKLQAQIFQELSPWQKTQLSRHPNRPYTRDYVDRIFKNFTELHGDRNFMDDASILGGLADFDGQTIMVIGHQKGRNTRENLVRNFGMPRPEGYRKALRLMSMAERFRVPILTFIDTPGAYPGIGAEERGQAEAIAKNLLVMSKLDVPILCTVIGEGGSGGALAIGVGNRILMMEYSIYSVISPEACASILWKDSSKASLAADTLRYTAQDAEKLALADEIIKEPLGGAHRDWDAAARSLAKTLRSHLETINKLSPADVVQHRYDKLRKMGTFSEPSAKANGKAAT